MINSTAFDYVNVLTKAADASYQREAILANNISNVDTPGYKRKDLNFEGVLSQELGRCKHQSLDKKISELDIGITDGGPVRLASITVSRILWDVVGTECSVVIELDRPITDIVTETVT